MYKLKTEVTFEAAHFLPNYLGPCGSIHGHTWRAEVICETNKLNKAGMVVDFSVIKNIIRKFDHRIVNDILPNPTAENIARYIYERVPYCKEVKVWETEKNCVTYSKRGLPVDN